jgi:hypothetical protein
MKILDVAQECFYGEFVAGKYKPYFGLHVITPINFSEFNQIWSFSIFIKVRPVGAAPIRADGQTHLTQIIGSYCNYANEPKKETNKAAKLNMKRKKSDRHRQTRKKENRKYLYRRCKDRKKRTKGQYKESNVYLYAADGRRQEYTWKGTNIHGDVKIAFS